MKNVADDLAIAFGVAFRESIEQIGAIAIFFWKIVRAFPSSIKKIHLIFEQMMRLGVSSLPIVFLTSVFIGAVSAWQVQYLFSNAIPLTYLGTAVGKAVFTEIGPVFTALIITGRIGAKLAAEIGTMRVTEQIDALVCLSLNPFSYLLAPRLFATMVMLPVLTIFSAFFAIISAQLLSEYALGLSFADFYQGVKWLFKVQDIVILLIKSLVFGTVIGLSGCYYGYLTTGGATGVGKSTKMAVVAAMVLILVSNFIVQNVLL
jgi:phospholipid/cholesterol/gamma-HCH transport system permease protein